MKKNKKLKIIFKNGLDVDYRLHDSELAEKWASKIKHLKNLPIDPIESYTEDVSDIRGIYNEFCNFAGIKPIEIDPLDNFKLNQLHQTYEEHHDRLSRLKNNAILYKLHLSVHFHQDKTSANIHVGWGKHEGPLTKQFNCYDFYEDSIVRNYIYLPWSELGKTPMKYWKHQEPSDQSRFNALAKPHTTFRAKFYIALQDVTPQPFNEAFVEWFDHYKQGWLAHHGLAKWENVNEYCSPLLATTDYRDTLKHLTVDRIII
jgi:hypothetical protein